MAIMRSMNTAHTPDEVLATVKTLRARARKVAPANRGAHHQIAMRCIRDAALFATRNTEHAISRCWEARFHLNHCA